MQVQNVVKYIAVVLLAMFCAYRLKISCHFKVHFVQVWWLFMGHSLVFKPKVKS